MRKLTEENRKLLLIQLHKDIDAASSKVAKSLSMGQYQEIVYPPSPDAKLNDQEKEAIRKLNGIPNLESALKKIIRDSHSLPLFSFFNCIDGTGDPAGDKWTGVTLVDLDIEEDGDKEFLHDAYFETYWDYINN